MPFSVWNKPEAGKYDVHDILSTIICDTEGPSRLANISYRQRLKIHRTNNSDLLTCSIPSVRRVPVNRSHGSCHLSLSCLYYSSQSLLHFHFLDLRKWSFHFCFVLLGIHIIRLLIFDFPFSCNVN